MPKPLASLLIGLLAAVPLTADAKPKPKGKAAAKVHIERAAKAHEAGKFDVALTELEAAYSIDPQPKLLYGIAQVYAKLGNCTQAIAHYEKFLATTKDQSKQEVIKQAIAGCKPKEGAPVADKPDDKDAVFRQRKPDDKELPTADAKPAAGKFEAWPEPKPEAKPELPPEPKPEAKPEAKPIAPPPPPVQNKPVEPPPPPPVATVPHASSPRPWYKDPLGDVLVLGGVGASVVSFFMYQGALSDLDAAEQKLSLAEYQDLVDSAHAKRTYTVILAGSGLTLIAAGVVRYLTRDTGSESSNVALVPSHGGGLITWSGGF